VTFILTCFELIADDRNYLSVDGCCMEVKTEPEPGGADVTDGHSRHEQTTTGAFVCFETVSLCLLYGIAISVSLSTVVLLFVDIFALF